MKKLFLTMSLVLASPLLLAQTSGDEQDKVRKQTQPATPATPALPATPATPASPSSSGDEPELNAPTTDDEGTTSGSARGKGQGIGGSVNPNQGTGGISGKSSSDFGTLDANGDGKLSRDEVRANAGLKWEDLDRNSDGQVSRGEYTTGLKAKPKTGNSGVNPPRTPETEGSDRTDKDDELNRRLN